MTAPNINPEQATSIRTRHDALRNWLKANKRNSYHRDELPIDIDPPSNDELTALELYEWRTDPPDQYFLYINTDARIATTWTGATLGDVCLGREYRDNFGGVRVPVWITGTNGRRYQGTYFKSAGDYARVRKVKTR